VAGEAGGDLRVEDVDDVGSPRAPQDRDVLAGGVQDDLDLGIGEHLRERLEVELAQRVEERGADAVRLVLVGHGDLHEAQQRPVAPLRHELRVDAEPAGRAGQFGDLGDHFAAGQRGNRFLLHGPSL
jgi:hypothetical protein